MTAHPNFTWDDLMFFLAVARTGQLSTAARRLGSSHATVSRRIDRLEFALKVRLFERNPRGYVLTAIGQRFVETAEKIEAEAERLQTEISGGTSAQRGIIRMSAPEGFANFFLAHRLRDFTAAYPNLSLELVTIQQIMSLSRKEADLAVALDPPKGGPYDCEKIADYSLHIYGLRSYVESQEPLRSRDDLLRHPFIGYIEDMIFAPGLDYLGDVHRGIRARFQSSSIFAQLTATRSGLGLCILPNYIAREYPELQIVLADEVELRRTYWMICHHDLRNVPKVRMSIDFLFNIVQANRTRFLRELDSATGSAS